MKQKNNSEDLVYKFWRKYEEADLLKRRELLKPIVKNFKSMVNIKDEKLCQHTFETFLQSYFDDLLEYCSCKDLIKKKR